MCIGLGPCADYCPDCSDAVSILHQPGGVARSYSR